MNIRKMINLLIDIEAVNGQVEVYFDCDYCKHENKFDLLEVKRENRIILSQKKEKKS